MVRTGLALTCSETEILSVDIKMFKKKSINIVLINVVCQISGLLVELPKLAVLLQSCSLFRFYTLSLEYGSVC